MSTWKKSPFHGQISMRDRYPISQNLLDPWAGDEAFYPFSDQTLQQALFDKEKLGFYLHNAHLKGRLFHLYHDGAPLNICQQPCSTELLAHICEDWVPDIGLFAQERVLGPFAPYAPLRALCSAVLSFSPLLKHGLTPVGRYGEIRRNKRSPSVGIQAKAPTMIWKTDEHGIPIPLLPLAKQYHPTGTVKGIPSNTFVIARIFPIPQGYQSCCVLPLPCFGEKYIHNRLKIEWLELQRCNKKIFWEDVLRYRSELIYRSALEYCFVKAKEETYTCWDSFLSLATRES